MATAAEQRAWYTQDNELLIEQVKLVSFLYDKADPRYKDSVARDNAWEAIGKIIGQNAESTKKRWELLRDSFSRAIRRCRQFPITKIDQETIKWRYSKNMWFLYEYISPRKSLPSMYYSSADSRALVEVGDDHDSLNSLTEFAVNCSPPQIELDEEEDDIDDEEGERSPPYHDGPPSLRPQDVDPADEDSLVYRDTGGLGTKPRRKMARWQHRQQPRHNHQQPSSTMQNRDNVEERLVFVKDNNYGVVGAGASGGPSADHLNCPIEMFCRSLVPHFKRVPDSQLLLAQTAVMQALSPFLQFNNSH